MTDIKNCKAKDPANCRYHGTLKSVATVDFSYDHQLVEAEAAQSIIDEKHLGPEFLEARRRNLLRWLPENQLDVVDARIKEAADRLRFLKSRQLIARLKSEVSGMKRSVKGATAELAEAQARKDFLYPNNSARVLGRKVFAGIREVTKVEALEILNIRGGGFDKEVEEYAHGRVEYAFSLEKNPHGVLSTEKLIKFIDGAWYK